MKIICIHLISLVHLIVAKFQETNKCHGYRQESVTAMQKNCPPCAALLLTSTGHGAPEDSAVGHVNAVVDSRTAESLAGLSSPLVWFSTPVYITCLCCADSAEAKTRWDCGLGAARCGGVVAAAPTAAFML